MKIIKIGVCVYLVFVIRKIVMVYLELTKNGGKSLFFNGLNKVFKRNELEENQFNLFFSGLNFDFRKMEDPPEEIDLIINARFSGANIRIPESWNVELDGIDDKSGINNLIENKDDAEVTLKINYNFKYSGMNIRT